MNSKHFCMRKPTNFHNVLACEKFWLRAKSVSMHTQTLPQSGLLHLFSHEVVPAIAALPYQPDLMTQDRQVAHEADRCHGPGKEEARGLGFKPAEKRDVRSQAERKNFQRKKKVHLSTIKLCETRPCQQSA